MGSEDRKVKLTRTTGALACLVVAGIALSGCTSTTDPDQVGLYYMQGSVDGNEFDHCTEPSKTDDYEWNNQIIYLPASLRTWTIDDGEVADTKDPITVSTKPTEGQPSGVQVNVWTQTKFVLNTFCDANGGVIKQFWETIGRRYQADTEQGWRKMLLETIVPALKTVTRNVVREYGADELVGNVGGVQQKAQAAISSQFATELNRLAGGPFFCGPTFNRDSKDCPAVELILTSVEYADPGIQAARNEKQKAIEEAAAKLARAQGEAAALVAEAKGKVDAAKELEKLYANPAWVKLQLAIMDLEAVKACSQNPNCKMVIGADGNLVIQ
jgi:hypothetical protein